MKTILSKSVLLLLTSIVLFSSCTVQKRRYTSGYHVDWHLNLASKNSKHVENKALAAKETPVLAIADKLKVVDTTSSSIGVNVVKNIPNEEPKLVGNKNQKPSKSETELHSSSESKTSKVANGISKSIQKLEIVEKIAPKLSKSFSKNSNQINTNNKDHKSRKGVWSFVLVLAAWGFLFLAVAIAFGSGGDLLLFIFLIMALISAIMSLVMGLSAMLSPKDTVDLIFGIIGTVGILLSFALVLTWIGAL